MLRHKNRYNRLHCCEISNRIKSQNRYVTGVKKFDRMTALQYRKVRFLAHLAFAGKKVNTKSKESRWASEKGTVGG